MAKTKTSPETTSVPTYELDEKAVKIAETVDSPRATLQRSAVGFGRAWRQHGVAKPNTRALALSAIWQVAPCTAEEAAAALRPLAEQGILGSGTPRSYVVAFIKNGYLYPCS